MNRVCATKNILCQCIVAYVQALRVTYAGIMLTLLQWRYNSSIDSDAFSFFLNQARRTLKLKEITTTVNTKPCKGINLKGGCTITNQPLAYKKIPFTISRSKDPKTKSPIWFYCYFYHISGFPARKQTRSDDRNNYFRNRPFPGLMQMYESFHPSDLLQSKKGLGVATSCRCVTHGRDSNRNTCGHLILFNLRKANLVRYRISDSVLTLRDSAVNVCIRN